MLSVLFMTQEHYIHCFIWSSKYSFYQNFVHKGTYSQKLNKTPKTTCDKQVIKYPWKNILRNMSRIVTLSPQRCLPFNLQNLWVCFFTQLKGPWKFWDGEMILDYLDGTNAITRVLIKGRQRVRIRDVIMEEEVRERFEDLKLHCWLWRWGSGLQPRNAGDL